MKDDRMRHGMAGRKLKPHKSAHRQGMFCQHGRGSLIEHEQIITTLPKAKDLRRVLPIKSHHPG